MPEHKPKRWFATLIDGPCDGKQVEIIGWCYEHKVSTKKLRGLTPGDRKRLKTFLWVTAMYAWNEWEGKQYGFFRGYYDGNGRCIACRRPGRRIGPRART